MKEQTWHSADEMKTTLLDTKGEVRYPDIVLCAANVLLYCHHLMVHMFRCCVFINLLLTHLTLHIMFSWAYFSLVFIRSTSESRPNSIEGKNVRPSVHKKFLQFE